jgi:hypothetical protein
VGRYVLGFVLRLLLLLFIPFFIFAQQPYPVSSCISYEMNRINSETGEFVLRNVFKEQLYLTLEKNFPDVDISWSSWITSLYEYTGEDGKEKTKLEGCFDVSKIHENSELVTSIMRVGMERFQAAMKFYSKKSSELISEEKIDVMLNGYEDIFGSKKFQKIIKDELEHNKQINQDK